MNTRLELKLIELNSLRLLYVRTQKWKNCSTKLISIRYDFAIDSYGQFMINSH